MSIEDDYDAHLAAADQSVRERMLEAGWAVMSVETAEGVGLRLTPKGLESLKRLAAIYDELGEEFSVIEASAFYQIIKAQGRR